MSDLDKAKGIIQNRIDKVDDTLAKTAKLADISSALQQQKDQDQFTLALIDSLPADFSEENAPRWLVAEIESDKAFSVGIPALPEITQAMIQATYTSASGTVSVYVHSASALVQEALGDQENKPEWFEGITFVLDEYDNRVSQREYIPARFNALNRNRRRLG